MYCVGLITSNGVIEMNEQIIEMAKQCGYWNGQTIEMNDVGITKFAELIIQKCKSQLALIAITNFENKDITWTVETAIVNIEEHFGVKE